MSATCGRFSRTAGSRSWRPISASASSSSTTSLRATSSCRRSTSSRPTLRGSLPKRSGPTPRTATFTTWPRASASTRGPTSSRAEAGMTGANFAGRGDRQRRGLHQRGQRRPQRQPAQALHRLDRHRKDHSRIEHLGVFVRMLSRSALGSPITQLTSHFRAPRDGTEMHIVLVDNGRVGAAGHGRLLVFAEMHSLRRVHEHMPGLPAQRRLELRRDVLRTHRRHHRSDLQPAQIQHAALCLDPERKLHQRLPGQDQHPRADLQVAAESSASATSCR